VPDCTLANAGDIIVLRPAVPEPRSPSSSPPSSPAARAAAKRASSVAAVAAAGKSVAERLRDEGVVQAVAVEEEQLRGVLWGDPVCHSMELYARRVEGLAARMVTGVEL
jgi:hypothetical protein